ncbi:MULTISPECIES: hypothetical protein [unclassified Alcanivorax]|jgi:hypothetical protein|uniref:hypothetical protein n=1 Tax=unclassified Alcanivorax TaxID=2638842 RepID=UPI002353F294|nr:MULTISPECIES: hypothetical protein [unclassified Alcanivorax]|tara:strand:+ start:10834 stop:10989 length:156 start_codon:yes stop_codon:yes gene_type:complete
MQIQSYSATQICVMRDNGSIIMRTIVDDNEQGRQCLVRWIERYKQRKETDK